MYFLSKELGKHLHEIRAYPISVIDGWIGYYALLEEEREEQQRKAKVERDRTALRNKFTRR